MRALSCATLCVLLVLGCGNQPPAQVCAARTEVTADDIVVGGYEGVALLVVVDNSGSMEEEQAILSAGFFSLMSSLVNPVAGPDWPYPTVDNIRVAVVSSDMGLQYGEDHSIEGFPYGDTTVPSCTDEPPRGDDGRFQTAMPESIMLASGQIKCQKYGDQCPGDWSCDGGMCVSPSGGTEPVTCPRLPDEAITTGTTEDDRNTDLPVQVACLGQLGTSGCGVKQQLEASVRALSRNDEQAGFMKYDRLLAVLVVSDDDDCSVEDRGLFDTPQWKSGLNAKPDNPTTGLLNTACSMPRSNEEDYLFSTDRYWTELVKLKGDHARDVFFAAIVGVPAGDDSPCQGRGHEIGDCLSHEDMKLEVSLQNGGDGEYRHFEPACERMEGEDLVTSARPGRRYVKVAESFGVNGYVHSICNRDWSPVLKEIAKVLAGHGSRCYPNHLEWSFLSQERQEELSCPDCGVSKCSFVVKFKYEKDEGQTCPAEFGIDPSDVVKEYEKDNDGEITGVLLNCPLPRFPAEYDCDRARARYPTDGERFGWFYCEDHNEDFAETCNDGVDNDGVDGADCDDAKCAECCTEDKVGCRTSCKYGVILTRAAREAAWGNMVSVQCPKYIPTEDENCQENTHAACNDGIDNNGDGMWDCGNDFSPGGYHYADPHCCPMTVAENHMCVIDTTATEANCGEALPDACMRAALLHQCDMSNY